MQRSTKLDLESSFLDRPQSSTKPEFPSSKIPLPTRPLLRRDQSVPTSQQIPFMPPPPPPSLPQQQHVNNDPTINTNSLSFGQLKRLVSDMPTAEPAPYAFRYTDTASFREELEEWFTYSKEEQRMMLTVWKSFAKVWEEYQFTLLGKQITYEEGDIDWIIATEPIKIDFLKNLKAGLQQHDRAQRVQYLEALAYVAVGCWYETAGAKVEEGPDLSSDDIRDGHLPHSSSSDQQTDSQVSWIKMNMKLISSNGVLQPVFEMLVQLCQDESFSGAYEAESPQDTDDLAKSQQWCCFTIIYFMLEVAALREENVSQRVEEQIINLKPDLLLHMAEVVSRFRWGESTSLPLNKILLLTWKAIVVQLGGLAEVDRVKLYLRDELSEGGDNNDHHLLTASPLDYHVFRQEISSKYPAYNPPPPLLPLEPENNTILPLLHRSSRQGDNGIGLGNLNGDGTSILHQPVHIATPAPSPPPSPAGPGGKSGKKQNYQTNQLFPFLYPPLDEASNNLGGKGSTNLQDSLVTRKWEGSDIPSSILEAAELFAKRMKVTRPMKQLWEERTNFLRYERGWDGAVSSNSEEKMVDTGYEKPNNFTGDIACNDKIVADRLNAVENFYRDSLPYLQSIIIVLLKVVLSTITAAMSQNSGTSSFQCASQFQDTQVPHNVESSDGDLETDRTQLNGQVISVETADATRTQEIIAKSVSGILILLLKWFKISHVLKFEYLTQLLLDSNYIPLILKVLQSQELDQAVSFRCDKDELSIFHFCSLNSRHRHQKSNDDQYKDTDEDFDDAAPPPVVKMRRYSLGIEDHDNDQRLLHPPVVDELGVPTSSLPLEPITTFNWRIFFSSINFLRIMQKICKNKGHRNLLLVQYKSSQYLKKALKVPQSDLRLYTLKLFKNQVPYCGRKWRQSNMRVITAVYLHCRPELRDDWLAGSDIDAEVEEALPLEQALRALTYWHNLKRYADKIGADQGILEKEQDFFAKELQKMEFEEEIMASREADLGWDGPIQVNGW